MGRARAALVGACGILRIAEPDAWPRGAEVDVSAPEMVSSR